jgi:hypothetical protein
MNDTGINRTHTAFTLKQAGKRASSRWVELGTARLDDGGAMHVFLDVLPIGGFNGYLYLAPAGELPPTVEPILRRPSRGNVEESDEGE